MYVSEIVIKLSELYGFNYHEAMVLLDINKSSTVNNHDPSCDSSINKTDKNDNIKPFNGIVIKECCQAVVYNHGLYTQCINITDREFCSSVCKRQKYGNIDYRKNFPVGTYILKNGKKEISYEKVKKRLNKCKHEMDKVKRILTEDSDSDNELELEIDKKSRGRPKMEIKDIDVRIDSIDSGEEIEEILVKRTIINNKEYLITDNNILYDMKTYRIIGKYVLGKIIDLDIK